MMEMNMNNKRMRLYILPNLKQASSLTSVMGWGDIHEVSHVVKYWSHSGIAKSKYFKWVTK